MTIVSAAEPREIRVARERALAVEDRSASVCFGIGPARAEGISKGRAEKLLSALSPRVEAVRWARQVHGSELAMVAGTGPERALCVGAVDALATSEPGIALMVWTADCVPVILVGSQAVAVAHAGWRGCAAGVVRNTVETLGVPTAELCAYLGPSISAAHYEVGPEVIDALTATGVPVSAWLDGSLVDLRLFVAEQLRGLGVGCVRPVGPCTFASSRFASYRRDGAAAGRQWSLVYKTKTNEPPLG